VESALEWGRALPLAILPGN